MAKTNNSDNFLNEISADPFDSMVKKVAAGEASIQDLIKEAFDDMEKTRDERIKNLKNAICFDNFGLDGDAGNIIHGAVANVSGMVKEAKSSMFRRLIAKFKKNK